MTPRLIRLRDAPRYLGMDRNRFNLEVRPLLREVPIGAQGVAFDRVDLDAWADDYIARNGRAPKKGEIWGESDLPACVGPEASGTSRSRSEAMARFEKALERRTTMKQSNT